MNFRILPIHVVDKNSMFNVISNRHHPQPVLKIKYLGLILPNIFIHFPEFSFDKL